MIKTTFYYHNSNHYLKPFTFALPGQTEYIERVPVPLPAPPFDEDGKLPQGWKPPELKFEEVVHKLELPDNAQIVRPRLDESGHPLPGEWPILSSSGIGWDYTEDHRQRKDVRGRIVKGSGTPYWLPAPHGEDNWRSEPRYADDIGPLPEGALLARPEKPQSEIANELRKQRDVRINATQWLVERHADEVSAKDKTTLSPEVYAALLAYRQTLRDMPQQAGFPWDGGGEMTPWPVSPV